MLANALQCAKTTDNLQVGDELSIARHRLGDSHAFQRRNFQTQRHRLRDCYRDHPVTLFEGSSRNFCDRRRMLTWRPSAWMASFVAASTSFLPRRPTNASAKGRKHLHLQLLRIPGTLPRKRQSLRTRHAAALQTPVRIIMY